MEPTDSSHPIHCAGLPSRSKLLCSCGLSLYLPHELVSRNESWTRINSFMYWPCGARHPARDPARATPRKGPRKGDAPQGTPQGRRPARDPARATPRKVNISLSIFLFCIDRDRSPARDTKYWVQRCLPSLYLPLSLSFSLSFSLPLFRSLLICSSGLSLSFCLSVCLSFSLFLSFYLSFFHPLPLSI